MKTEYLENGNISYDDGMIEDSFFKERIKPLMVDLLGNGFETAEYEAHNNTKGNIILEIQPDGIKGDEFFYIEILFNKHKLLLNKIYVNEICGDLIFTVSIQD